MLAFPDVMHFLADELARGGGGRLSVPQVCLRAFDGLLFRHAPDRFKTSAKRLRDRGELNAALYGLALQWSGTVVPKVGRCQGRGGAHLVRNARILSAE